MLEPSLTDGSWECDDCAPVRNITGGFASTVPEPASWALMLIGFGALGLGLRATRKDRARRRLIEFRMGAPRRRPPCRRGLKSGSKTATPY
jgi:hypothetical protein